MVVGEDCGVVCGYVFLIYDLGVEYCFDYGVDYDVFY